jgi:hypothetical protein
MACPSAVEPQHTPWLFRQPFFAFLKHNEQGSGSHFLNHLWLIARESYEIDACLN